MTTDCALEKINCKEEQRKFGGWMGLSVQKIIKKGDTRPSL